MLQCLLPVLAWSQASQVKRLRCPCCGSLTHAVLLLSAQGPYVCWERACQAVCLLFCILAHLGLETLQQPSLFAPPCPVPAQGNTVNPQGLPQREEVTVPCWHPKLRYASGIANCHLSKCKVLSLNRTPSPLDTLSTEKSAGSAERCHTREVMLAAVLKDAFSGAGACPAWPLLGFLRAAVPLCGQTSVLCCACHLTSSSSSATFSYGTSCPPVVFRKLYFACKSQVPATSFCKFCPLSFNPTLSRTLEAI